MKIYKRILWVALALSVLLVPILAQSEPEIRVASLKGPTSMGLVKLIQDDKDIGKYSFTVAGTADEIVPGLVKGDLDIALVPCNLASVLYNKTQGNVRVAAVNTLGVLYVVEVGDTVTTIDDLKGQTLYSTGKGTTPEYALNAVLSANGIDPVQDLNIEFKSESTEVASALTAGQVKLAMLPQPYVTAVSAQVEGLRVALSLTDEWAKAIPDSNLVTGVVLIRADLIENKPESVAEFMNAYRESTAYTNAHPAEASQWIEELGIAKAKIAEKAIPACNIVCMEGEEMIASVQGYLAALYAQDPTSVGGSLPGDDFYYVG